MVQSVIYYIKFPIGIYVSVLVFYTLYIAAINLYRDWSSLATWLRVVASPMIAALLVVDSSMQFTLFTLLFLDLPRELLVTSRLQRYRDNPAYANTWRNRVATLICTQALNPFDPTRHHC
jgi:hypothetical protein